MRKAISRAGCSVRFWPQRRLCSGVPKDEYDLLVIGGGSGGLACAKEAAALGKKVAVLDFVKPSPQGSKWGLGGTCVNVGCIPKKLMHHGALIGQTLKDAHTYGWAAEYVKSSFNWHRLCDAIRNHIRSLNWGHRVQLNDNKAKYYNAYGSFIDSHTVKADDGKREQMIHSKHIVIATGLRPKYPDIPGSREGVTSDDLFTLKKEPGKTLIVGGGCTCVHVYCSFFNFQFPFEDVALECAGFLSGLGYPVTVMIRSVPLRGFDQQMAQIAASNLEVHGTQLLWKCIPTSVKRQNDSLAVDYVNDKGERHTESFDTVLWAIGREPRLEGMNLTNAGIKCHGDSGRVIVDKTDRSSAENVYAIGDVQHDGLELTPVAIRAGKLLARRLFAGSQELMDYDTVPTTVFTPIEYSCVGLSEEAAEEKFGHDAIDVYHAQFIPLEFSIPGRKEDKCYIKVVCQRSPPGTVLGIHYLGPNAGEVMQGFAVAIQCGLTMDKLLGTVGIHPTNAEEIVKLRITKRSGKNASVTGC